MAKEGTEDPRKRGERRRKELKGMEKLARSGHLRKDSKEKKASITPNKTDSREGNEDLYGKMSLIAEHSFQANYGKGDIGYGI